MSGAFAVSSSAFTGKLLDEIYTKCPRNREEGEVLASILELINRIRMGLDLLESEKCIDRQTREKIQRLPDTSYLRSALITFDGLCKGCSEIKRLNNLNLAHLTSLSNYTERSALLSCLTHLVLDKGLTIPTKLKELQKSIFEFQSSCAPACPEDLIAFLEAEEPTTFTKGSFLILKNQSLDDVKILFKLEKITLLGVLQKRWQQRKTQIFEGLFRLSHIGFSTEIILTYETLELVMDQLYVGIQNTFLHEHLPSIRDRLRLLQENRKSLEEIYPLLQHQTTLTTQTQEKPEVVLSFSMSCVQIMDLISKELPPELFPCDVHYLIEDEGNRRLRTIVGLAAQICAQIGGVDLIQSEKRVDLDPKIQIVLNFLIVLLGSPEIWFIHERAEVYLTLHTIFSDLKSSGVKVDVAKKSNGDAESLLECFAELQQQQPQIVHFQQIPSLYTFFQKSKGGS